MSKANGRARSGMAVLDPDHEAANVQQEESNVEIANPSEPVAEAKAEVAPVVEIPPAVVSIGQMELTLPLVAPPQKTYYQRHIDLRLTPLQQRGAKWLYEGLHAAHAKTAKGRHVDNVTDVLRYILDEAGKAVDSLAMATSP